MTAPCPLRTETSSVAGVAGDVVERAYRLG
jgi:hypothetical protein